MLWNETKYTCFRVSKKISKELERRNLGHPLVEARCDGSLLIKTDLQSVRTSVMNYWFRINALGLAIGKNVHLILQCKNPKIPGLVYHRAPQAKQWRGSTHENVPFDRLSEEEK